MKLLIVEDDIDLCHAMAVYLKKEGFDSDICNNGAEAVDFISVYSYDLILLDRMLPAQDGLSILSIIRNKGIMTPIILVTAMNGIHDRVDGLDTGADDYLVKPFALEELTARIRALLRRPRKMEITNKLEFLNLTLEPNERKLCNGTLSVTLSKKETALMEYFFRNAKQTLTREQLLVRVWGSDSFAEESSLENYISFLRKRLHFVESKAIIKTIHGTGYRIQENGAE